MTINPIIKVINCRWWNYFWVVCFYKQKHYKLILSQQSTQNIQYCINMAYTKIHLTVLLLIFTMLHIKYIYNTAQGMKEGNVLFSDAPQHFIYGYMASDHSDSERGNLLPPQGLLTLISSKGSFICTIPQKR